MSKKSKVAEDPIVKEVRTARQAIADEFDNDVEKFCRKMMDQQKTSRRRYITPRKRRRPSHS